MRLTSSRPVLVFALIVLGALCVGYNGCVPVFSMAVVQPPDAVSVDDYEVLVIDAHGDIRRIPYPEFRDARSIVPFFEEAPPAR